MGPAPLVVEWLGSLVRELALWGGVLLLASALSFYRRARSATVGGTPRRDVASVRSPGTVRVRGEVVPRTAHDPFDSPIAGDEVSVLGDAAPRREAAEPTASPDDLVLAGAADAPLSLSERPVDGSPTAAGRCSSVCSPASSGPPCWRRAS